MPTPYADILPTSSRIGVCLAGGGGKGGGQCGAISALDEMLGERIVALSGTSIGAFNALHWALGRLSDLRQFWFKGISLWRFVLPNKFGRGTNPLERRVGALLVSVISYNKDLYVNYYNGRRRESVTQRIRPLSLSGIGSIFAYRHVTRSMRIPGVLDPEAYCLEDEQEYAMDGGVVANANLAPLIEDQSIDTIIVVLNTPDGPGPERPRFRLQQLWQAFNASIEHHVERELNRVERYNKFADRVPELRRIKLIVLRPPTAYRNSTLTFNGAKARADYELMYAHTKKALTA